MEAKNPVALFRLSVLEPLISKEQLKHGELKFIVNELALPITHKFQLDFLIQVAHT